MVTSVLSTVLFGGALFLATVSGQDDETWCSRIQLFALSSPQYITFPRSPGKYGRNVSCRWDIKGYDGYTIKLQAVDSDLGKRQTVLCDYSDHVEILDGSSTGRRLGIFCGREIASFQSTKSSVVVKFKSTLFGKSGKGFKLKFFQGIFVHKTYATVILQANSEAKSFVAPKVSYEEYRFVKMSWRISARSSADQVYVRSIMSHISSYDCGKNYFEVFDGFDNSSTSLGKWCGQLTLEKYSSGRYLYVTLHAQHFNSEYEFEIEYGLKPKEGSGTSLGVAGIAGISCGLIAFIGIVYIVTKIACARCKDKDDNSSDEDTEEAARRERLFQNDQETDNMPSNRATPSAPPVGGNIELSAPPPSYEEVMGTPK